MAGAAVSREFPREPYFGGPLTNWAHKPPNVAMHIFKAPFKIRVDFEVRASEDCIEGGWFASVRRAGQEEPVAMCTSFEAADAAVRLLRIR